MERRIEVLDVSIRGDGRTPGLETRVRINEDFIMGIKRFAWWLIAGVLGVWGSLAWSITQHYIKGGP